MLRWELRAFSINQSISNICVEVSSRSHWFSRRRSACASKRKESRKRRKIKNNQSINQSIKIFSVAQIVNYYWDHENSRVTIEHLRRFTTQTQKCIPDDAEFVRFKPFFILAYPQRIYWGINHRISNKKLLHNKLRQIADNTIVY